MAVVRQYLRVYWTFLRNGLVREMSFRGNFLIEMLTRAFWFAAQLVLFGIIYRNVPAIEGWSREQYFAFMATGMLVNALVETFFMTNCANFGELIRTGNLDFALLKPIDTQFLISFEKIDLPTLSQVAYAAGLLGYSLWTLHGKGELPEGISVLDVTMYLLLVLAAVAFFYSLMLVLSCLSLWFGRNQSVEDFWFYITVFARYPQAIYSGTPLGEVLRFSFSYVVPILLVITVPASLLVQKALEPSWLTAVMIGSAAMGIALSRGLFVWSLRHYRSASS